MKGVSNEGEGNIFFNVGLEHWSTFNKKSHSLKWLYISSWLVEGCFISEILANKIDVVAS